MKFLNEMWARLTTADTPKFFRKVQIMGGSIGALGISFKAISATQSIAGYLITASAIMVAVGQMACTNAPQNLKP